MIDNPTQGSGPEIYNRLSTARTTVLDRARAASKLTIPGLIPDEGQNEHATFEQPYQSMGSRCVKHLSSALLLALFPPGYPFFRLSIDEQVVAQLGTELGEAQARLAVIGRSTYNLMEAANIRPTSAVALMHLVVAGNVLEYTPQSGPSRVYRLDQYVVRRDPGGALVEAAIKERVHPAVLPQETLNAIGKSTLRPTEELLDLYTVVRRVPGKNEVEWWQEIKGVKLPGSDGKSPADASPWLFLRWQIVPGSDYGRGHVTEYIGDLLSLEDLYKSMVQFAAVAGRIIHIVDPNAGIDVEELAAAETGDFLTGYKDRISTLQLEKFNDWRVMADLAERLERRLAAAFLLTTAVTRNAERVTAEEVRLVAQELENVLGGTYTVLSSEMQLPLVRRFMYMGARAGKVPKLPDSVQPTVVTGFDALGRAHSVNRIRAWLGDLQQALGPRAIAIVNETEVAKRLGEGHGVDGLENLLKSAEQLAQDASGQQQAGLIQAAAPQIAKAAGDAVVSQIQPQEQ